MNVLYLSPAFPPTAWQFCAALRQRGVHVVSIGDEPLDDGSPARRSVDDYVCEPRLEEYPRLLAAARKLAQQHGPFDRVESNGEYWLELEARLRGDLDVPGLQLERLQRQRSKLGMESLFAAAGVDYPPTARADDVGRVRAFAAEHGFPLVFKPDIGAGAVRTFSVCSARELEEALQRPLPYHLVQPFIHGDIITYDGLTDRDGKIVFATSHVYDVGIMQLRQQVGRDGYYHSLRHVPPALAELGQRVVRAFEVRERFFHIEFFARSDGSYVALEMNLRPPGGFTTDLMNYAADIDVYALWADIVTGRTLEGIQYEPRYFTAHAGRRHSRAYRIDEPDLRLRLGTALVAVRPVTPSSADTMGDVAYLLRHPDLQALTAAISLVQAI
jgi:biotin carboxylase